ncbi:tyrosine-type recombinase/integrase [Candidatus Micrarchaeota archaeon]|nr:tyrosine-type recombinase/integrase [Candidatus Micrarchaeota archaeon]
MNMGNAIDIYNLPKRIEYYERRLNDDLEVCEANKTAVKSFLNVCRAEGLGNARISIYAVRLYYLAKWLRKAFADATKEDLQTLVAGIERQPISAAYKQMFRVSLKKFYRITEGGGETYPDKVKWLKTSKKSGSRILPEELLTPEDVRKLIDAGENPRDKAFVSVLYESGCRVGEIAGLKIKHVAFDAYGAQIIVNGKTGMRRIRLVNAVHYLTFWLEHHPWKKDPEAPLWPRLARSRRGEPMNYATIHMCLIRLAKRAGVTGVHPFFGTCS